MFTITYDNEVGTPWVFSESLAANDEECLLFVHIITNLTKDGFETEICGYGFDGDVSNPLLTYVLSRKAGRWPRWIGLHVWHEHVLATHQYLFRDRKLPYLAHILVSLAGQVRVRATVAFRQVLDCLKVAYKSQS